MRRYLLLTRRIGAICILILGLFGIPQVTAIRVTDVAVFHELELALVTAMLVASIDALVCIAIRQNTFLFHVIAGLCYVLLMGDVTLNPLPSNIGGTDIVGIYIAVTLWPAILLFDLMLTPTAGVIYRTLWRNDHA